VNNGYSEHQAGIAQLVEQRTENPRVGGSSPPPGTLKPRGLELLASSPLSAYPDYSAKKGLTGAENGIKNGII
jgi:hypothetical protein